MMTTNTVPAKVENLIAVMKRYELKYVLTKEQTDYLKESLKGYMEIDRFGLTTIESLYYDTPDYRLIRQSIEKPVFKEKIRLRSYGQASENSPVFLELKRKAYGIVYKRRIQSTISNVEKVFEGKSDLCENDQISSEIITFINHYQTLIPSCLILYDRTAYFETNGSLRLTIDENPRYRTDNFDLTFSLNGIPLLDEGESILEVKVQDAIPLWLSRILSNGKIYKNSFSKYGEAYKQQLLKLAN